MVQKMDNQSLINDFINTQVIKSGLDERTVKAYRLDLVKFYQWLESNEMGYPLIYQSKMDKQKITFDILSPSINYMLEEKMEDYLEYLSKEKGFRNSTIDRKYKVFSYYLSYLSMQGIINGYRLLKQVKHSQETFIDTLLTKKEVDLFFEAINQEYIELDSNFRKRICLRDQVMMKLLFYHGIEISELLQLQIPNYNRQTATLMIHRKREKNRPVYLFSQELQSQMAEWLSEHEYFEHDPLYHSFLFLSKLGKPLSMKMIINIFDKYRIQAGIKKECTPKDLKNSFGRYAKEMMIELC